jgi:glycine oxidase
MPVRGQMLLYRSSRALIDWIVNDGHRYLVPRFDGYLLAGSCEEEVGFEAETTDDMVGQLHAWASGLLPILKETMLERSWAGLRPGTIDGLPYIGSLGHDSNTYVAAGHFRHGIHLSPGTARVLVDLMRGLEPCIDLSLFHVLRGRSYTANVTMH